MACCKEKQVELLSPGPSGKAAALYLHVPFCRVKCRYCDFYSRVFSSPAAEAYVTAAAAELRLCEDRLDGPLGSVYVGGGTPTVLPAGLLRRLLGRLGRWVGAETEFSVEANPATVNRSLAGMLVDLGVNRISLGAQSFDDDELRLLGRVHNAGEISVSAGIWRQAGIENLGLDLIYGIPGQSLESWQRSLNRALELAPRHVSCYALSFEPGTPLAADLRAGRLEEVDEQLQREMYYLAIEFFENRSSAGLEQYEISNFARGGGQCRHNMVYWRNQPYVGIGPAACSYLGGWRINNSPDLEAYTRDLGEGGPPPATCEKLTGRAAMAETLMLALRLREGVHVGRFVERYGISPSEAFGRSIGRYVSAGALEITPTHIRLCRDALFTSDTVLADIIAEAER